MTSIETHAPILVVDDPKILQLVGRTSSARGFVVTTAADGFAALAALRGSLPRLIVLDLMLPTLDGVSVLRAAPAD